VIAVIRDMCAESVFKKIEQEVSGDAESSNALEFDESVSSLSYTDVGATFLVGGLVLHMYRRSYMTTSDSVLGCLFSTLCDLFKVFHGIE